LGSQHARLSIAAHHSRDIIRRSPRRPIGAATTACTTANRCRSTGDASADGPKNTDEQFNNAAHRHANIRSADACHNYG
jgi:hypothetical protein